MTSAFSPGRWRSGIGAVVVAMAVLVAGCSGDAGEGRRPDADSASAGGAFADTVRGVVTLRETGGMTFHRCGSDAELWLLEESGADLSVAARGLAEPGTSLYAELEAASVPAPETGPGSEMSGALQVRRWVYLAEDSSGCGRLEGRSDEPEPEGGGPLPAGVAWRAQGNEPFWMADVRADRILVARPGQDSVSVPPVAPDADGGTLAWTAETEAHTLELRVEEEPCNDSMSGFRFSHTALLVLDGTEYAGCARPGPAADGVEGGGGEGTGSVPPGS